MAITRTLTIKVNGKKSTLSKKVYLYLGDGGTTLMLEILDYEGNNIPEAFAAIQASVCILTASNKIIYDRGCPVIDGLIEFELSSDFVNEIAEEGTHLLQIHLFDGLEENRYTIPPITLTLLKPICGITTDPSTP